jgi:hypothetical protein
LRHGPRCQALPTRRRFQAGCAASSDTRRFRVLRKRTLRTVPLVEAEDLPGEEVLADRLLEQRRQSAMALAAISGLPNRLREPATLFFIHECSHQDIAVFLGLSVATVNNRLHAARSKLKERMLITSLGLTIGGAARKSRGGSIHPPPAPFWDGERIKFSPPSPLANGSARQALIFSVRR